MMTWLAVFVGMFALDVVYARYTQAITAGKSTGAALYAAILIGLSAFVTVSYVQDHWLVVPLVAGAAIGTWVAVKWPPKGAR